MNLIAVLWSNEFPLSHTLGIRFSFVYARLALEEVSKRHTLWRQAKDEHRTFQTIQTCGSLGRTMRIEGCDADIWSLA
jgi:hypothetical protein